MAEEKKTEGYTDFIKEQGGKHITRKAWNSFTSEQRKALVKGAGEGGRRSVARLNKQDQIAAGTYQGAPGGKTSAPEIVPPAPPPQAQEDPSFAINQAMGDRKAKLRKNSGFKSTIFTSSTGLTDLAADKQPGKVQ